MNRKEYIKSRFERILKENLDEKADAILDRLNYKEEAPFEKPGGPFDYVQEGEDEVCEQCGSEMSEGECMECGSQSKGEVMEFEGMDYEDEDFGYAKHDGSFGGDDSDDEWEEIDVELDEDESYEMKEKLYGRQSKLDKNKNGRLDKEDFKMLRDKKRSHIEELDDYENDSLYEIEFKRTGGGKNVNETLIFTENELISLIEQIATEKNSFKMKEPKGYVEYKKAHGGDKKEEDDYMKSLAKKMTDYLKDSTKGKFEMNPKKFPQGNNTIDKESKAKKYTPSEAVEEYEDAFSYPGQTNLVYDEIKPNDKNIEKYLKGHKTTGNAQVDEDGNALGNVVPSEVGDKFYKNFKDNLYGQEQMSASYKRQPQPVDMAGEETERGSLKSKRGKKTSQSVLNAVDESVNEKQTQKLNEEFGRIQNLMGYNRKTQ